MASRKLFSTCVHRDGFASTAHWYISERGRHPGLPATRGLVLRVTAFRSGPGLPGLAPLVEGCPGGSHLRPGDLFPGEKDGVDGGYGLVQATLASVPEH